MHHLLSRYTIIIFGTPKIPMIFHTIPYLKKKRSTSIIPLNLDTPIVSHDVPSSSPAATPRGPDIAASRSKSPADRCWKPKFAAIRVHLRAPLAAALGLKARGFGAAHSAKYNNQCANERRIARSARKNTDANCSTIFALC